MKLITLTEINRYIPLELQSKYNLIKQNLAMFLAQTTYESVCYTQFNESFNYTPTGLLKTFPDYFDNDQAKQYGRVGYQKANQEAIANIAYANRIGNGDIESGEGYKYRGRGALHLTGKENYTGYSLEFNVDCIENPDLLLQLPYAIQSAIWFWNQKKINNANNNIEAVTKIINGGLNGLSDRAELYQQYLQLLGVK